MIDHAAENLDQDQAHEGHERDHDVAQDVLEEHDPHRHALGDGRAHVVLVIGRDDALAHELRVGGACSRPRTSDRQGQDFEIVGERRPRRRVVRGGDQPSQGRHADEQHQPDPEHRRGEAEEAEALDEPVGQRPS